MFVSYERCQDPYKGVDIARAPRDVCLRLFQDMLGEFEREQLRNCFNHILSGIAVQAESIFTQHPRPPGSSISCPVDKKSCAVVDGLWFKSHVQKKPADIANGMQAEPLHDAGVLAAVAIALIHRSCTSGRACIEPIAVLG
jgi:hypothetical protein